MTGENTTRDIVLYWRDKAVESLESAKAEYGAGRLTFAMNRAYYSCFYSASAVLMAMGKKFKKHSGVKSGVRQFLINEGLLDSSWGRFYNRIFERRQRGDYVEMVEFSREETMDAIDQSERFVEVMGNIIDQYL